MSDQSSHSERLTEVARLTTVLTDQVVDALIMKRPIPEGQTRALAKAARLLHDNDLPWPPMLSQVLHELTQGRTEAEAELEPLNETTDDTALTGLSRFLGAFRRERGQAG